MHCFISYSYSFFWILRANSQVLFEQFDQSPNVVSNGKQTLLNPLVVYVRQHKCSHMIGG